MAEKKERVKAWKIVLGIFIVIIFFGVNFLPKLWGLDWLPGWPVILAWLIPAVICLPIIGWLWDDMSLRKLKDDFHQKKFGRLFGSLLFWLLILFGPLLMDFGDLKETREYIYSPSGKNVAVVLDGKASISRWKYFYEDDRNNQAWYYDLSNTTYRWLDDNTLEFVRTYEDGSEETKQLRW